MNRIILKRNLFYACLWNFCTSNIIGVLSNFRTLLINGHKLIIQDKADGHYPQLVINSHEMTGIEIVITIIMKLGRKKKKAWHFSYEPASFSKELMFFSSLNQVAWIIFNSLYSLLILLQSSCHWPQVKFCNPSYIPWILGSEQGATMMGKKYYTSPPRISRNMS